MKTTNAAIEVSMRVTSLYKCRVIGLLQRAWNNVLCPQGNKSARETIKLFLMRPGRNEWGVDTAEQRVGRPYRIVSDSKPIRQTKKRKEMRIDELQKHIEDVAAKVRGIVFIADGLSYVVIKRGQNGEYVIMDALNGDIVDMSKVSFDKGMAIFEAMEKLSDGLN